MDGHRLLGVFGIAAVADKAAIQTAAQMMRQKQIDCFLENTPLSLHESAADRHKLPSPTGCKTGRTAFISEPSTADLLGRSGFELLHGLSLSKIKQGVYNYCCIFLHECMQARLDASIRPDRIDTLADYAFLKIGCLPVSEIDQP
ncbi:hypothetical protein [Ruegeria sp.]|uniref:hypothetical protein n=1 Tax=Ruegeria sp. TaxID=1879320 RepID=UPI002314C121|nr:hypothetical protein [Ruegeria sp.]MDA7966232.1 hypothetical protein [Ruegeria sp.]